MSKVINSLLLVPLISTIGLGFTLFLFGIYNDYILYHLVDIAEKLVSNSLMSSSWLAPLTKLNILLLNMPTFVDYLFLISFVGMIFAMFYYSYKANRQGYFEIFTYLSYGAIVFLFVLSIIKLVSDYIYEMFFNTILQNLSANLTYFTFYYNNMHWINLSILVLMIVVNYIDLNNFKYMQKKQNDMVSDEI